MDTPAKQPASIRFRLLPVLSLAFLALTAVSARAGLLGGLTPVVDTLTGAVSETVDTVSETVDTLSETVDTASSEVDSLVTVVEEQTEPLVEFTSTVVDSITDNPLVSVEPEASGGSADSTAKQATSLLGEAQAVITEVLGSRSVLADTGPLVVAPDSLYDSLPEGVIAATPVGELVTAAVLHATTTSGGNHVASTASLAELALNVDAGLFRGVVDVSVDFIRAEATAISGEAARGDSVIEGLSVNGRPIPVSGQVNQVVSLVGGLGARLIINEQQQVPGGIRVNALHLVVPGVADVVLASATAGMPQ